MRQKKRIVLIPILMLLFSSAAVAQPKLNHLKSWADKYPSEKKGTEFFALPEIRTPLLRLLHRPDFNLMTRSYSVEAPIKLIGDYLVAKVCKPHDCGDRQAAFAINLSTGVIYVRMQEGEKERWFASKGSQNDMPKEARDHMGDFSRN